MVRYRTGESSVITHFLFYLKGVRPMTIEERALVEKEIREQIAAERRAYKRKWRSENKDRVNAYYRAWYRKRKAQEQRGQAV